MVRKAIDSKTARAGDPESNVPKHWVLLVYAGERSYAGNPGYSDVPAEEYRFDSSVPNHKRLAEGDLVAIRTRKGIEGFARIARISSKPGTRTRRECPQCGIPDLRERFSSTPRFRCRRGHEFDHPAERATPCTLYTANFGGSFVRLSQPLAPALAIQMRRSRGAQQFAIQPADFNHVDSVHLPERVKLWVLGLAEEPTLVPSDADERGVDAYVLGEEDSRQVVLRQIRQRRGQRSFRDSLLSVFMHRCAVTGCVVPDLLEAAHIHPYRGPQDNHLSNGLLLRTDVHTLFDLHLLGIDPDTLTVFLHPCLRNSEYASLAGRRIASPVGVPSSAALKWRWDRFMAMPEASR